MKKYLTKLSKQRVSVRFTAGLCGVGALVAAFFGGRALAAIPEDDVLRYSGTLVGLDGSPIEGNHEIEVQFGAAPSGPTLCTTTEPSASVTLGRFSIVLDDACVDDVLNNQNLYVQVVVDGEEFGWSKIGAVPYAVEAGRAAVADSADTASGSLDSRLTSVEAKLVPQGAVMAFDSATCPEGWSLLASAQGRTIVGTPFGGTLAGTVGNSLTDLENRTHTHSVDPASVASSSHDGHTHSVDPSGFTSGSYDLSHTHTVDPDSISLPTHRHQWAQVYYNNSAIPSWEWETFNDDGSTRSLVTWNDGMDSAGSGNYPLEDAFHSPGWNYYYTYNQVVHNGGAWAIDLPSKASSSASVSMSHGHYVDVPATTSVMNGAHTHDVDVAATTSTSASTSAVMPYVQLLYCKKD